MASPGNEGQSSSGLLQDHDQGASTGDDQSKFPKQKGIKFGVKSYLHHFYEDCTGLGQLDDEADYKIKDTTSRYTLIARIGFAISIVFIVLGILLLLLGFVIPQRETDFIDGGVTKINADNVRFNSFLTYSRWVGAFSFCCGGIQLSIFIVLLGVGKLRKRNEILERRRFQERLLQNAEESQACRGTDEFGNLIQYGTCEPSTSASPTQPVPTSLMEVTKVQPTE